MINYKEARAGNLVMYDNRLFQIESISRSLPCLNTDEFGIGVVDWNNIQPISLTPEILEKCGFVMHKTSQLWRTYNFYLHHYLVSDNEYCFKYSDFTSSSIQYLHQLQNLYFALCGEELNYTP